MSDTAVGWQATRRVDPFETGELHQSLIGRRSWTRRHPRLAGFLVVLALLAAALTAAQVFVVRILSVQTVSMAPTLEPDDRLVLNRLDTSPSRGDVVAHDDVDGGGLDLGRVIAFEGETITINDGEVLVDGAVVAEPYLAPSAMTDSFEPYTVPAGAVFLLGDNRRQDDDAWQTGAVDVDAIIGTMIWAL